MFKTFKLGEVKALRFDASLYNVTNFAQWGYPSVPSVADTQSQSLPFGLITNNINSPRQFQFGARFIF